MNNKKKKIIVFFFSLFFFSLIDLGDKKFANQHSFDFFLEARKNGLKS